MSLIYVLMFALIPLLNAQSAVQQPPANQVVNNPSSVAPVVKADPPTPTTSTTPAPVTTSPAPPTPTPPPNPDSWTGNVTAGNTTCIRAQFSVQVIVKYNNTNNTKELETGFDIPKGAVVDVSKSFCSSDKEPLEALTISFKNEFNTSATLTLTFNRTADNKTVFVQDVELSFLLSKALFPQFIDEKAYNTTVKASNPTSDLFSVASVHSYTCSAAQSVQLSHSTSGIIDIQIDFLKSKVEAYIEDAKKGEWDSEIDCKSSEISDVVPIAVGAALAGLVVIVLIAYFIGRRRSRRLAYQSV